jgi:hypothetical protein
MIKTEETSTANVKDFVITVKTSGENIVYEKINFIKKNESTFEYVHSEENKREFKDWNEERRYENEMEKLNKSILVIMNIAYGPFEKVRWDNSALIIKIKGKEYSMNLRNGDLNPIKKL